MLKHIVRENEDLDTICKSYYGVSQKVYLIIETNNFLSKRDIVNGLPQVFPDDILIIP